MTTLQPDFAVCAHSALFEPHLATAVGFDFHRVYERGEACSRGRFRFHDGLIAAHRQCQAASRAIAARYREVSRHG